jgi:hypothetical protein
MMKWLAALLLVLAAATVPSTADEARHTMFALGGNQVAMGKDPFFSWTVDGATLARDADAITITVEDYGVPWFEFASSTEPPENHAWTTTMRKFASNMESASKPLILQLVLTRDKLAKRAMADETLKGDDNWQKACYDFEDDEAKVATAFMNYAVWMVRTFKPVHVVSGVEITEYLRVCGDDAWPDVVKVLNTTYDAIKAVSPKIKVYPSATASVLYGDQVNGFNEPIYKLFANLKRDHFGLSIYPLALKSGETPVRVASQLPHDLLVRVNVRYPDEAPTVVTETGWNSVTAAVGTPKNCASEAISASPQKAAEYIKWLGQAAAKDKIGLIVWWSAWDLLPEDVPRTCYPKFGWFSAKPCKDDMHCIVVNIFRDAFGGNGMVGEIVYKIFATMGIYDNKGRPKPFVTATWKSLRAKPYKP